MTRLLTLATEAAETGGGSSGATIAVVILLVALAGFAVAYVVVGPGRRTGPRRKGDIPLSMRPYHSDKELETTALERAMAWGVALSTFAAIFVPLYWFIEDERINEKRDFFYDEDVEHGRQQFAANCTTCHGPNAEGGTAPHPDPNVDAPWPAPPLNNIVARYEDTGLLDLYGTDAASRLRNFMIQTIKQGRAGTPMPAWGSAFQGAMNDQQVEWIVTYLLSIQTGEVDAAGQAVTGLDGASLFEGNCARCHGLDAMGRVGPDLTNVFARFGANADDPESVAQARAAVRHTIVNGRNVPTGAPMPAWGAVLSDADIDELVRYLEAIQQ
ncbi:MAG TPA: c-type cytochrome [Nitriliruptorales bacterium]